MEKIQIEKNKLDLEFSRYSQLLKGVFIFATTGLIGFIGSFVWSEDLDKLLIGVFISVIIMVGSFTYYKKINYKLDKISEQILMLVKKDG